MCGSKKPDPPPTPLPPPPPIAPLLPPKSAVEETDARSAVKRLGKKKLQIPLNSSGTGGLAIPT